MAYLKPQSPLQHKDGDYFYPLTTVDQIVMENGSRLNTEISKHLIIDTSGAESAEPNGINADTLGGYPADDYVRKEEIGNMGSVNSVQINYSVVGSLTEPENPTQNMIWVETDVEITGHILSKNEPKNPIEGFVWFILNDTSNAALHTLLVNGREFDEIYLLSAKQFISNVWVEKTAKIHQNGEWVDWIVYLYNEGNRCTNITGGWEFNTSMKLNGGSNASNGISFNANNITTALSKVGIANTVNRIDVTQYRTLNFYVDVQGTSGSDVYGVIDNYDDIYTKCAAAKIGTTGIGLQVVSIDIASLTGEYYVVWGSSNRIRVMYKVWME